MTFVTGQIINERYRIVKQLAQGGFGAVYRAWDLNLKVPCAVKENPSSQEAVQEQFISEASILATLRHPNLPRVTDFFSIPGMGQYLVMDYIEGKDLQEMLDEQQGPLPEEQVLSWIAQIGDALAYLHEQDPPIIHRDIKPANIKITADNKAVLVDFGIAKIQRPKKLTAIGARAVTPGFSPPEQYGQGATDIRSDVYALGATIYALLTGEAPADSVDLLSGAAALPSVSAVNAQVSPSTSAVVERAMQLEKKERFESVVAFMSALTPAPPTVKEVAPEAYQVIPEAQAVPFEEKSKTSLKGVWMGLAIGLILIALVVCAGAVIGGPRLLEFYRGISATQTQLARALLPTNTPSPTKSPSPVPFSPTPSPTVPSPTTPAPTTPAPSSTPTATATSSVIVLTEWQAVSFLLLADGCNIRGIPCWKSNDRLAIGYDSVTLTSKDSILIDQSWENPYLAFWHEYDFDLSANITLKTSRGWAIVKTYGKGKRSWSQEFVDIGQYKGEDVLIKFTMEPYHKVSTWILQDIQIIPNYSD